VRRREVPAGHIEGDWAWDWRVDDIVVAFGEDAITVILDVVGDWWVLRLL
jgi:autotransporter translocation and assembly factor TamB